MTDNDGSTSNSDIRTLMYDTEELVLAPNPADNGRVAIVPTLRADKDYSITVMSLSGTEVFRKDHVISSEIDLGNLTAGIYLLKLTDSDGKVRIQRVIIR